MITENNKFKMLLDDTIELNGLTLYRIEAKRDINNPYKFIRKGEKGGYIHCIINLSEEGDCWIFGNAKATEDTRIYHNAYMLDDAVVSGMSELHDYAHLSKNASISGSVRLYNNAHVTDDAQVRGRAEVSLSGYIGGNSVVDGRVLIDGTVIDNAMVLGIRDEKDNLSSGHYIQIGKDVKISAYAKVGGFHIEIDGNAEITDHAIVSSHTTIQDNAKIFGSAVVSGNVINSSVIGGQTSIGGTAEVESCILLGDHDISKGKLIGKHHKDLQKLNVVLN